MNMTHDLVSGVSVALLLMLGTPLEAQQLPFAQRPLNEMSLRPSGQPVIPLFDGWFENADGTYSLCFGYFNLNTDEALDVPLGPDNAVEPIRFDGMQPTHFDPVPDPSLTAKYRHHWCVFTVQVPPDFGDQRVVWTLTSQGEALSVPGRLTPAYVLEELTSPGRGAAAPVLQLDPDGPKGRGRNGISAGPRTVDAGAPLTITAWVEHPEPRTWLGWTKHQGPGAVTFSESEVLVEQAIGSGTTTARFSEPGDYLLRVQAINDPGEHNPTEGFEFHCCWTNGYIQITVTP